jgi:hypothetical protein
MSHPTAIHSWLISCVQPVILGGQNKGRFDMKKFILVSAILAAMVFSTPAGNERLIGTWKSNKAATLTYLKGHTKFTPQQLEKVGSILGKLEIVFDKENITEKSGDWKFASKYKILEETKDSVVIESQDQDTKKPTKTKLELDATGFWVSDDKIAGYKERFDKIAAPTNRAK